VSVATDVFGTKRLRKSCYQYSWASVWPSTVGKLYICGWVWQRPRHQWYAMHICIL